jgi:hypothetical protein
MPFRVTLDWPEFAVIHPTEAWQTTRVRLANPSDFRVDQNFYVISSEDKATP